MMYVIFILLFTVAGAVVLGVDGALAGLALGVGLALVIYLISSISSGVFTVATTRKCPHCKETMKRSATVCPHCQRDVVEPE